MDASIPAQSSLNSSVIKHHESMAKISMPMRNPMMSMPNGAKEMDDNKSSIPSMTGAKTWQ